MITDVLSDNFKDLYPVICTQIKNATFVSIDGEFSGLNSYSESLFDTVDERYTLMKQGIVDYTIIQLGLSFFHFDRNTNSFSSNTYCFYLKSPDLPGIPKNLTFQKSAMTFLSRTGLDWGKLFSKGVTYTSLHDERRIIAHIKEEKLNLEICSQIRDHDFNKIERLLRMVQEWHTNSDSEQLDLLLPDTSDAAFIYYLSSDIIFRFPKCWVTYNASKYLTVRRVSAAERLELMANATPCHDVTTYFKGFSCLFWELVNSKKTIVGHNSFRDLAMMYQQFVGPLPSSYRRFKKEINELFPSVYDTKHLTSEIIYIWPKDKPFEVHSLEELYKYFSEGQGKNLDLYSPRVSTKTTGEFHNAGYDAFCTGYCFTKLAFYFSIYEKRSLKLPFTPQTWGSLVGGLDSYINCINLIRGPVHYINLGGRDPPMKRPRPLHVTSKNPIDIIEITKLLKDFGRPDVRYTSRNSVVLAPANRSAALKITEELLKNDYSVKQVSQSLSSCIKLGLVAAVIAVIGCLTKAYF